MIGPRDSVIRWLRGEPVPLEDMFLDHSEFVDSSPLEWFDIPECWVDKIHDYCDPEAV